MGKKSIDCSRRNFWSMSVEGGFYFTGYTFFDVYAVIPVFVDVMTGDLRLAGLAATLRLAFSILPQLVMGHFTPKIRNVPLFLGISAIIGRAGYIITPLMLILDVNPYIAVLTLYFSLSVGAFCDGLTHVPWLDLFGRTIPENKRGKLLGYQQFLGGMGGFAAGLLIKAFLAAKGVGDHIKYAEIFFMGTMMLSISGGLLFTLKDWTRKPGEYGHSILEYFKGLHRHIKANKKYTRYITTQCLGYFGGLAAPLYVLFAKKHFGFGLGTVTTLMFVQIIGNLAGGIIWGNLSHKKGNKFTIQASIAVNITISAMAAVLALTEVPGAFFFVLVTVFGAGTLMGAWLGYTNYLLEIVDEEQRPVYIAITSTIQFPFTLISFLGGILAEYIGFFGVFTMVVIFMALTLAASFKLEGNR